MAATYGLFRTAIQAGARLGPAALAATFTNTMQDGYRDHAYSRRTLVNATITSPLGDATDLGVYMTVANDLFHIPGPLTFAEATSTPRIANATYKARDERRWNRLGRIGVSLRHSLSSTPGKACLV